MEALSANVQQVSTNVQDISAAVEQQTVSTQEAGAAAMELTRVATVLRELIRQFRLEEPVAEPKEARRWAA